MGCTGAPLIACIAIPFGLLVHGELWCTADSTFLASCVILFQRCSEQYTLFSSFFFLFFCAVHSVLQVFNKIHPSAQLAVKRQMNLAELNSFEFLESDNSGSSSGSHASALSLEPFEFWESENKGGSSDSRASAPSYRVPSKELLPISFRELDW